MVSEQWNEGSMVTVVYGACMVSGYDPVAADLSEVMQCGLYDMSIDQQSATLGYSWCVLLFIGPN